jgi:hypothetical protein
LEVAVQTLASICVVLLTLQTVPVQKPDTPIEELPDEDYAIYSLVLQTHFAKDGVERIVLGDHTLMDFPPIMMGMTQFGGSEDAKTIRESAAKETLEDYERRNKSSIALGNKFSLKAPLVLMSAAERDRVFMVTGEGKKRAARPKAMEAFQKLYPKAPGFMHISRIGFNAGRTQAFLYAGYVCGGLCGSGYIFLLTKENGKWKIQHVAMTWIS